MRVPGTVVAAVSPWAGTTTVGGVDAGDVAPNQEAGLDADSISSRLAGKVREVQWWMRPCRAYSFVHPARVVRVHFVGGDTDVCVWVGGVT